MHDMCEKYTLLNAYEDSRDSRSAYVFEYTVQKGDMVDNPRIAPDLYIRKVSVVMSKCDDLYTLTTIAPESVWSEKGTAAKR